MATNADGLLDVRSVERALRAAGLTRRQARALLATGWSGVVDVARAEADELKLELDSLRATVADGTIQSSPPDV